MKLANTFKSMLVTFDIYENGISYSKLLSYKNQINIIIFIILDMYNKYNYEVCDPNIVLDKSGNVVIEFCDNGIRKIKMKVATNGFYIIEYIENNKVEKIYSSDGVCNDKTTEFIHKCFEY